MMTAGKGTPLHGDWRRRIGTKTDAHLYPPRTFRLTGATVPLCGKRIRKDATAPVTRGRPCTACLVAAITAPR